MTEQKQEQKQGQVNYTPAARTQVGTIGLERWTGTNDKGEPYDSIKIVGTKSVQVTLADGSKKWISEDVKIKTSPQEVPALVEKLQEIAQ